MPKIDAPEKIFFSLLGKEMSDEELVDIFPVAKAELDGHDTKDHVIKIELNDTNRPDLWSAAGVARALKTYESGEVRKYDFFSTKENSLPSDGRAVIDDESAIGIRDYSIGFAARGKVVDNDLLINLIQSQEKLCTNFGRKRKTIALGIYRSDLIKYPVHYAAVDPDKTAFVPLGMEEKLTLREICEKHPKGKEYGYIVSDKPRFPYLYDDNNDTLSFPPVINSTRIGAVEVGDSDLFVELSGPILEDLLLTASILSCDMADMGFEILPVKVELAKETKYGKEITVPFYFQDTQKCSVKAVEKKLGLKLSGDDCVKALKRMGVEATCSGDEITVFCPPYRNDFLHEVDVIEDIMIGHGLENFSPLMPHDFTVGRLSPAEEFARKVKEIMVGLGFQEMMYNYLGSKKEYIERMHTDGKDAVFILNPMSENYEVVRPSVIPSLLESESVSGHAVYPHNIFEVGKICIKDKHDNSGTVTKNSLGFLVSDNQVGYNEASSIIYTLMYFLNKEYILTPVENDPRFIPGRAANIIYNSRKVGLFGEIHPQVLESWGSDMPTIAAEIDLDALLEEKKPEVKKEKKAEPQEEESITEQFKKKVILKVSRIVDVQRHPGGDKLYILQLDTGEGERRQIVSSIVPYYKEEELMGRNIILVSNLKPANFRGVKSNGMLLAASEKDDTEHRTCELIFADDLPVGAVIEFDNQEPVEKIKTYLKPEHFFALPMRVVDGTVCVEGNPLGYGGKHLKVYKYIDGNVG